MGKGFFEENMRLAICDDNKDDLLYINKVLKAALTAKDIECQIKLFEGAEDLLLENKKRKFDAVFLDIDMPNMGGMEAASRLNELHESTEIIFVTNHDELVYKAFRFKALGFIRKKCLESEMSDVLDALIESVSSSNMTFELPGAERQFSVTEIIYIQSDEHYLKVVAKDRDFYLRGKLNDIEKIVSGYGFIRIHSRYLVNYRSIYVIEQNEVVLDDKIRLPISRNKLSSVKASFGFFMRKGK